MVNLGLTKVDDALVAKHPVGFLFVFMHFYYLCTLEDTVPLHTWNKPAAAHIDTFSIGKTEMCNKLRWELFLFVVSQGLESYAACQSHAFMKGSGTFVLGNTFIYLFIPSHILKIRNISVHVQSLTFSYLYILNAFIQILVGFEPVRAAVFMCNSEPQLLSFFSALCWDF